MKRPNIEFSIEEAIRILSAYGLEEVQKVIGYTDDDLVDLLLDQYSLYEDKIMEWYINYLDDCYIESKENN